MRWVIFAYVALAYLIFGVVLAHAQAPRLAIITAVDVSHSVDPAELAFEADGMTRGIMDERFLDALAEGVGFEVFTWSSGGDFRTVVPYTILRTPQDAAAVAVLLRAIPGIRNQPAQYPDPTLQSRLPTVGLTALGEAMVYALNRALQVDAGRIVVNVVADSKSNEGLHPSAAKDRAFAQDVTVNAVIFGEASGEEAYFRENVITGPGAFVEVALTPADLQPILERKFWQDMVAGLAR